MSEKYEKENYVHMENYWQKYMPSVLLAHYNKLFRGRIADFGCNTGLFDIHLAGLKKVEEVVGFDVNKEAIDQAKLFAEQSPVKSKLKFVHKNLTEDLSYENYFDFIICFHTLEHIYPEDIDASVKNIHKTLKPGGYALINLPDKNSYLWETAHVYHPNKEELSELFQTHGFETIEAYEDERGGQVGHSRNITALYKK
jgi:2-polyprenyl-3-methyl-5-hydroxy-6-metoxy-1,4-benzoquinol methylase